MSTRLLALCGFFVPMIAGCGPAAAPAPVDQRAPTAEPTPAATPAATPSTPTKLDAAKLDAIGPRPAKEPPLTPEELELIAADPATLSPELRRKRGYALRRKILQNPDSPSARQLEALRISAEKGELQPHLPDRKADDKGLTLHSRNPGMPGMPGMPEMPDPPATPAPAPVKAP